MIVSFSSEPVAGAPQHGLIRTLLGLDDLAVGRTYYLEVDAEPSLEALQAFAKDLVSDLDEPFAINDAFPAGGVGVAFKLGVVDNEAPSIIEFARLHGIEATAAKVADVYTSGSPELEQRIRERMFNTSAQQIFTHAPAWEHLRPEGHAEPMARFDLRDLDDEQLAALGTSGGRSLSLEQMRVIRGIQEQTGAEDVTDVLLEALDARWSDHCAHTTWKQYGNLLKRLKQAAADTRNPNIVSMFDDNAGVWDFYAGQAITIKAETHNGPTAIAPYFGQLTKLGGVLRDILGTGLGSDPIGSFEYTATGVPGTAPAIPDRPAPSAIAIDTIRAIKEYGNTFGVPMMFSRMAFHDSYKAKPFALGGSLGIIPTEHAGRQKPSAGDVVVLIGGLTGGEGLHGASASSAGAEMVESAVQIGTPLEEVKFRSAILDLRDAGCLSAVTDLGAAGLNSAVGEMGEATGVWMNTALVPLKTSALPPWKILLSESQERMLLAVPLEKLDEARAIAERHAVPFSAIGRFVPTGRYTVVHSPELTDVLTDEPAWTADEVAFDVPYELIDPPVEQVEVGPMPDVPGDTAWPRQLPEIEDVFPRVMAHHEVQSQIWADSQYDSSVRGATLHGPQHGGPGNRVNTYYWAGQPVFGHPGVATFSTDFTPALYEVHPVRALRQSVVRILTGQVLAGATLNDVCLTDNFYTPHLTEDFDRWLVALVDELAALVRRFGTPVISGKDSSAGSTNTPDGPVHVPSAVYVSALGKVESPEGLLGETWQQAGNLLVRVGIPTPAFAGTVASALLDAGEGTLDEIDPAEAERVLDVLADTRGRLVSGTMLGAGGLASTLARQSIASGLGVEVSTELTDPRELLTEHRCCALVEVPAGTQLPDALHPVVIGRLVAKPGVWAGDHDLLSDQAMTAWRTSFQDSITGETR